MNKTLHIIFSLRTAGAACDRWFGAFLTVIYHQMTSIATILLHYKRKIRNLFINQRAVSADMPVQSFYTTKDNDLVVLFSRMSATGKFDLLKNIKNSKT
jgi:hypothetical protein